MSTTTIIPSRDFLIEVAKGNVPKHSIIHKFGRNGDISAGTVPEDVWSAGGMAIWQTTAQTLTISSDSGNDDATPTTSTGAQKIMVSGLDGNFALIEEEISLNGLADVVTTKTFIRVYRIFITEVGVYHGSNEGIITALYTNTTNTAAIIEAGSGQTTMAHFTIPAATTGYLLTAHLHIQTTKNVNIALCRVANADDITQPYTSAHRVAINFDGLTGDSDFTPRSPSKFDAKTDVWWQVTAASNNTAVSIDWDLLLVED